MVSRRSGAEFNTSSTSYQESGRPWAASCHSSSSTTGGVHSQQGRPGAQAVHLVGHWQDATTYVRTHMTFTSGD